MKTVEGYCYIWPLRERVNLGFFHGTSLADPGSLLEGTGTQLRHVKVASLEAADSPHIRALLEAALAERQEALGR